MSSRYQFQLANWILIHIINLWKKPLPSTCLRSQWFSWPHVLHPPKITGWPQWPIHRASIVWVLAASLSPKRMLVGTRWDIAGCLTGKWWMHGISSGRITRRVTTRLPGNFLLKNHLSLIKEQAILLWNTAWQTAHVWKRKRPTFSCGPFEIWLLDLGSNQGPAD